MIAMSGSIQTSIASVQGEAIAEPDMRRALGDGTGIHQAPLDLRRSVWRRKKAM